MHTLLINENSYPLPSRWNELTTRQLLTIAWLSSAGKQSVAMAKLLFLVLTQSLPWWHRQKVRFFYFFQASVDERADMVSLTRSFVQSREFTDQKIKKIGGKSVLFGPASALSNITLWEYIRAEQAFLQYIQANSPEHLDKLIAIMYRPARPGFDPNTHEDIRTPLIDPSVPLRMRQIRSVDKRTKTAILIWFDGCRAHMIKMFPTIFKKEENQLNKKLQAASSPTYSSSGWLDLITSLSSDMTQFEKIANTNLVIAFTDISNRIKQARNNKKK